MSTTLRSSRTVVGRIAAATAAAPAQPCQRCFSSKAGQSKNLRPTVARGAFADTRQPIVQKRTKYKTVEQAKSRYNLGVSPSFPTCARSRRVDALSGVGAD